MARRGNKSKPRAAARRSESAPPRRGGGGGGTVVAVVTAPPQTAPPKTAARKSGPPARRGGDNVAKRSKSGGGGFRKSETYAQVSKSVPIQVASSVSEATMALLGTAMDVVADSTDTTADDKALPYVKLGIGTGLRVLGDVFLSRKHAGLAKVVSAGASAMNGQTWGRAFERTAVKTAGTVARRS